MNYFDYHSAGKRYALGRPYFHPIVRDILTSHIRFEKKPLLALDIACGTGLSTRILADIANKVIGVDSSDGMINHAFLHPNIEYKISKAESLPFSDSSFDLATIALAFHWTDRRAFLNEARRVLKPDTYLVIYNHWFSGDMTSNSDFRIWNQLYLETYPSPKRDLSPFNKEDADDAGFDLDRKENFINYWPFTASDLASYLITQSNVIAAVKAGNKTVNEVYDWIMETVSSYFKYERETFTFGGNVMFLKNKK